MFQTVLLIVQRKYTTFIEIDVYLCLNSHCLIIFYKMQFTFLRLSRARNSIEDSFGILCARWQVLNNRLDFKLKTTEAIIKACICLHNFLITDELPKEKSSRPYIIPSTGNRREDENNLPIDEEVFPENAINQREILTNYFNSPEGGI